MRVPCLDLFCHSGTNPTTISPILTLLRHIGINVCTYPGHRVKLTANVHPSQGQGLRECERFWPTREIPSSHCKITQLKFSIPTLQPLSSNASHSMFISTSLDQHRHPSYPGDDKLSCFFDNFHPAQPGGVCNMAFQGCKTRVSCDLLCSKPVYSG